MKFKTITNQELGEGFINKEFADFETRVMTGQTTDEDKKEIAKEFAELGEDFFGENA
jgi:hypothetical protein